MPLCHLFSFRQRNLTSEDFFQAATSGNLKLLQEKTTKLKKKLIDKSFASTRLSKICNSTNFVGETPLVVASALGRLEVVRFLVEHCKADVNQVATFFPLTSRSYFSRGTPIHAAVMSGNLDLVEYLVNVQNADVNALSEKQTYYERTQDFYKGGNAPLHYAVYYLKGRERDLMIRFLVEKRADMTIRNRAGHFAWMMGIYDLTTALKLFIQLGMDVNLQDEQKETIAHQWARAVHFDALNVIDVLLEVGANFTLKNIDGMTPLMVAALGEHGKPNPRMFQRIFNGTSYKMSREETTIALELFGASYIIYSNSSTNSDKEMDIEYYLMESVRSRLSNYSTSQTSDESILTCQDVCKIESFEELDKFKEILENDPNKNENLGILAIKAMERILGCESRFVWKAKRRTAESLGPKFLFSPFLND